jgi:Ca2+:H+ antiporter
MGMGATINAFFSTVVEVYLYCIALDQGKGDIVEGSIVGSIFAGILLMPGLSMCAGAVRRKTQRYNPRSAGVSSTMLVFAVIGAFAPTIFYEIYGPYELHCAPCDKVTTAYCACRFQQVPLLANDFYFDVIRPFCLTSALLLFITYIIGLWFTLRTHAAMIWSTPTSTELHHQPSTVQALLGELPPAAIATNIGEQPVYADQGNGDPRKPRDGSIAVDPRKEVAGPADEPGGHDAPNWSRAKSSVILLGATILYAIIAEILVDTVDVVIQNFSISQKMLGITVFALVPNTTEFLNAISFAINGNVALSMEIGSAYALQVCLLQIPALILYSMVSTAPLQGPIRDFAFTLVFPHWDLWMVIFCVFLFSYIYAEGKSNYFKGSILILTYVVVITGFYFADHPLIQGFNASSLAMPGTATSEKLTHQGVSLS